MMKYFSLLLIILVLIASCKQDKGETINPVELNEKETVKLSSDRSNLNISILLDLSDRINSAKYANPAMEYYQRDLGYINSIAKSFEFHLLNKRSIKINDHIQLYMDPEPADNDLNEKIHVLNLSFTRNNAKRESILNTSILYDSISRQIYQSTITENNYIGSNIWGFFKTNVKDFCIEKDHRNILVILTDGYLYHKDAIIKEANKTSYLIPQNIRDYKLNRANWQDKIENQNFGFITTREDLQSLEVLVLGINPDRKNPYEQDVIFKYWKDWLTSMNVKNFEIKTANLPANMDKIIKGFILEE